MIIRRIRRYYISYIIRICAQSSTVRFHTFPLSALVRLGCYRIVKETRSPVFFGTFNIVNRVIISCKQQQLLDLNYTHYNIVLGTYIVFFFKKKKTLM